MSITKRKQKEWRDHVADQRTKDRRNYPGAPSAGKGILKVYRQLIKKASRDRKHFNALVLGATPETRDMVLEMGGNLATLDISEDMIKKCSALMKYAYHRREKIIIGDWLKSDFADSSFDIIIGDGVTNNISAKDHLKFFQESRRLLKKGGYLILRELILNSEERRSSVKTITKKYDRGAIHWFDMFISLYMRSYLEPKICNKEHCRWHMKKLFQEIYRHYKKGDISEKAFNAMWWFRGNLIHTFVAKEKFEKSLSKYFSLLPVKQADDFLFTKKFFLFFFGRVKK